MTAAPAINGTEERLDAILAEQQAIRQLLERLLAPAVETGPAKTTTTQKPPRKSK